MLEGGAEKRTLLMDVVVVVFLVLLCADLVLSIGLLSSLITSFLFFFK